MNRKEKTLLIIGISIVAVVGVSIILAAWMGNVGPGFMVSEELEVLSHTWAPDNAFIVLSVKNTGTGALSVISARVNDIVVAESNVVYAGSFTGTTHTLVPGASGTIIITLGFVSDTEYEFAMLTARGNKFTYCATAPNLRA